MKTSVRLFVAIWPGLLLRRGLTELQNNLRKCDSRKSVRWTRPEQLHLTLRFFGDVPISQIPETTGAIRTSVGEIQRFACSLQGLGCFPHIRKPRVLWAGFKGELAPLRDLHAALARDTGPIGHPPDHRPFQPHLTIGRPRPGQPLNRGLADFFESQDSPFIGEWLFNGLSLVQSTVSASGSHYTVLERFELA